MLEFIVAGMTFGFTAGIKPGPLGIYVLHQTLHRGYFAGLTTSLAPFVSDGPMIAIAFLVLRQLQHVESLMAVIAFLGAGYLMTLAWRMFHSEAQQDEADQPSSFLTAVRINLLNPIAWTFWMTVGGFYLVKGTADQAAVFVLLMLGTLVVTKFLFAASMRYLGSGMSQARMRLVSKALALVLAGFAVKLIIDGLIYLGA